MKQKLNIRHGFPFRKKVNRKYKDRLFRLIFSQKEDLLQLYNAVNSTNYQDPDILEVNTLDDAIYLSMKNDLSFILGSSINLYEHQSTWNPNMPLRGLFYLTKLYEQYVNGHKFRLTGTTLIPLPFPSYIVFYNGLEKETERTDLLLSNAFFPQKGNLTPCLECRATILNINSGQNRELMEKCRRLWEYAEFIKTIRQNLQQGMILEQAAAQAITYCLEHGILADILSKSQMEVQNMILEEYDEKAEREYLRKEALEEGMAKGMEMSKKQYLTLIENALESTHSITQTALLLKLQEDEVRKIAKDANIPVKDI